MASIRVKGTISRVFYEGKGLEVSEQFQTRAGETVSKLWTVWLNQPGLFDVGQTIQVEGLFSAEIDNWTNQDGTAKLNREGKPGQSIKLTINNPNVTPADPIATIKSLFEPTHSEPMPF
jgi:hypothetical protein